MRESDAWKATTPEPLQAAVSHIRENFDRVLWDSTRSEYDCHKAITDQLGKLPEPLVFQQYFNSLAKSLHILVENTFKLLYAIATSNEFDKPVEWATSQVKLMMQDTLLIEDEQVPCEATRIRNWIVTACDGRDDQPAPENAAEFKAWLFHRHWQSPTWLHMKPLGNSRYDPDQAWNRDSVEYSQHVLAFHAQLMWLAIQDRLQRLAGAAYIKAAVTPSPRGKQAKPPESASTDQSDASQASASPLTVPPEESDGGRFLWKGEVWEVSYQRKTAILKDSKGMRFLAVLLGDPRKSFDARELYQLVAGASGEYVELESGDRPLDDKARAEALREYNRLKIKKDAAIATEDMEIAAAIDEEMDELATHLAEQRDLYSPQSERARKNIGNQLESVTLRIAHTLPELAIHLRKSLRKGRFLSYQADLQWLVVLPSGLQNPPK